MFIKQHEISVQTRLHDTSLENNCLSTDEVFYLNIMCDKKLDE